MPFPPILTLQRQRIPAVFMRAGTSRGLFFKLEDLPESREDWAEVISHTMGSPDPFSRQLDGMGAGTSTTSKVAVVSKSADPRADVDYLFIQVPVAGSILDFNGNCDNIASGVGPFAVDEGLFHVKKTKEHETRVRIRNVNTGVIIHSHFLVRNKVPVESGSFQLDGVGTPGSPIRLDFQKPGGSMTGRLLPTGNPTDTFILPPSFPGGLSRTVRASCVDSGNPVVFVQAEDLGFNGNESNQALLAITPELLDIRALASVKMGLWSTVEEAVRSEGVPKVAIIGSPRSYVTPSGRVVRKEEIAIVIRAWSMGLPHPAFQMTGAVCLASACSIPGTLPYDIVHNSTGNRSPLKLGHASGTMDVNSETGGTDGAVEIASASVYRTARRLMQGTVLYLGNSRVV